MTHRISIATSVALSASSANAGVDSGQNFYGYWQWHAPVPLATYYNSPRDACIDLLNYQASNGNPGTLKSVVSTGDASNRNFTCNWTSDLDGSPQSSTGAAMSSYTCPPNASEVNIETGGKAENIRCHCDTGPCSSPSPPSFDTSTRCIQQRSFDPPSPRDPTPMMLSKANMMKAKRADPAFYAEYEEIADELSATEECVFQPSDYYHGEMNGAINIGYLCGFRKGDEAAANNLLRLKSTPQGYTWHHGLGMGSMQLVTQAAHAACGAHEGGVSAWKQALGIIDYAFILPKL